MTTPTSPADALAAEIESAAGQPDSLVAICRATATRLLALLRAADVSHYSDCPAMSMSFGPCNCNQRYTVKQIRHGAPVMV